MKKSLFTLLIFTAFCGTAQPLTLQQVLQQVQNNHPELKMYQSQAKAFEAMAEGATAWEAPQLEAGFFMTPYKTTYWKDQSMLLNGMPSNAPGMGNFMIQAKQMIPDPGKLAVNKRYQQAMSMVESANSQAAANNLVYQAKTAFYTVQILDRKLRILEETQHILSTMLQFGESKLAYNQQSLSGVYKVRAQDALLQKDKRIMEDERKAKLYELNRLMNRSEEELLQPDSAIEMKSYEEWSIDSSALLTSRSDIAAIDQNIRVFLLKQKADQAKSRPDFGIEYGHMFAFGGNPNQFTLMGMMSLPLVPWSSGMYKSGIKASRLQTEALRYQKEALVTESIAMLQNTQNELRSASYQLKLYKDIVLPSLQKVADLTLLAYSNNTGELTMTLEARMEVQMAHMQYWDTLLKRLQLQAAYEKQMQIF